jgi:hypothetical protein
MVRGNLSCSHYCKHWVWLKVVSIRALLERVPLRDIVHWELARMGGVLRAHRPDHESAESGPGDPLALWLSAVSSTV